MPTIADVAERAGVSAKTVSRVMNNYTHISERTRSKVEAAMAEVGYIPPSHAVASLETASSRSIGMLYSDPGSGYQSRLNHSVLKACSDSRRYLAVEFFDEDRPDWAAQLNAFLDRTEVKNLILVPPMCDSFDLQELLQERGINFVQIAPSRPLPGVPSIILDDRMAAREMTNHFIELGHKRIAHISGHPDHVATLLRRRGFEDALSKAGLDIRKDWILPGYFNFKRAAEQAEILLSGKDRPTAVFAANDESAAATIMVAHKLGLETPGDLSVGGFDDTQICQIVWPELTTIAQPFDEIGREAISLLREVGQGDGNVSETRVLTHKLIIRGSSGPAPSS